MAKPLGPKSQLIREAIAANPKLGNTELAELINSSDARKVDKIKVSANDVAQQRQALKKAGSNGQPGKPKKKKGKKPGKPALQPAASHSAPASRRSPTATARNSANPVELIDRVFDLAQDCGGVGELKKLVDRIASVGR